jgi:hypothetical protein
MIQEKLIYFEDNHNICLVWFKQTDTYIWIEAE